jgi:hypothetical protein
MSPWQVSPPYDLGQRSDPQDLPRFDSARDEHLIAFGRMSALDETNCSGGCGQHRRRCVVAEPDGLRIRDPKVDAYHRTMPGTLELPEPLMGRVEVPQDRHGKNPRRSSSRGPTAADASSPDPGGRSFWSQVHEVGHFTEAG